MNLIDRTHQTITKALADIKFTDEPAGLYAPISYTLSLGGKRIRPLLCLIATELFGGDSNYAIPPALGLEIFHNFTLLHDDIMDNAAVRRNKPTVHEKWDNNTAILYYRIFIVIYTVLCGGLYDGKSKVVIQFILAVFGLWNFESHFNIGGSYNSIPSRLFLAACGLKASLFYL